MKLLFCGLGQIARRHIEIIQQNYTHEIFALRRSASQPAGLAGVRELRSWDEADKLSFGAAFITSPTHAHISQAAECARRGIPLFVEKPLGSSTTGLAELVNLVQTKKLLTYVGYCFRFHPLVQEFKKKLEDLTVLHASVVFSSYMPDWRTKKNYQTSYIVRKAQGGGVILDCSHEIDLAEYLFGAVKTIDGVWGRASTLTIDAEDYADMILKHPQTVTALHLDFFSRVTQRYVEARTAELFLKLDLKKNKIFIGREGALQETPYEVDRDLMYREQLRYFFDHLASGKPMMNNIPDAARLLEQILAFRGK